MPHPALQPGASHPAFNDAAFARAVALIHAGDHESLRAHLDQHPTLVTRIAQGDGSHDEYRRGYFANPRLLHFTAYNPWWTEDVAMPGHIVEVVRVILEAGAEPDAECGDEPGWTWTTLGLVTSGNKPAQAGVLRPLIDVLIRHGADPDGGVLGAVSHGKWDAMAILDGHDLTPTPTVLAARNDPGPLPDALAKADDRERQIALFTAATRPSLDALRVLLEHGADPNAYLPIHTFSTTMHQAAWANRVEALAILVEHGGRLDLKDTTHHATPAQWAEHAGHTEASQWLRAAEHA